VGVYVVNRASIAGDCRAVGRSCATTSTSEPHSIGVAVAAANHVNITFSFEAQSHVCLC